MTEVPEFTRLFELIDGLPRRDRQGRRERRRWLHLHGGSRRDDELTVPAGDVEVMDGVVDSVAIGQDRHTRCRMELEMLAPLEAFAPRLHPHLHHALGDGGLVYKAGGMRNRVMHVRTPGSLQSGT